MADAQRLIANLRRPDAYPHPVEEIRLLETHISWVLLTGTFAYKIKKPVDLGFLDFTDLERRAFYCQEEMRLNGRLAPQLYLDVVPISGSLDAPRIAGDGPPIEYAVRMRQFPQEALLSRVIERNELLPEQVDSLARQLADFHRTAEIAPPGSRFGTLENLQRLLEDTFQDVAADERDEPRVMALKQWSQQELLVHRDILDARRRQGFVRECHGDMHLGNMLLLDGEPVIFDCIEFNDDFRWIDVLSETAFTVMDLEDRGSPTLARRFLNRYLEHTGDYAGLAMFRYYLVYRAVVRAKVSAIRLRQMDQQAGSHTGVLAEYRGYLDLAERYARPPRPLVIVTHGLSGSGKTTLTDALLERFESVRIRSDIERKRLFGHRPLERTKSDTAEGIYTAEATERTYARLAELAGAIVQSGFSVLVDAAFLQRTQRALLRQLAKSFDVPWVVLDIRASPAVLRQRIVDRARTGSDASEADLAVLDHQLASAEPLDDRERTCVIAIDSESPRSCPALIEQLERLQKAPVTSP